MKDGESHIARRAVAKKVKKEETTVAEMEEKRQEESREVEQETEKEKGKTEEPEEREKEEVRWRNWSRGGSRGLSWDALTKATR